MKKQCLFLAFCLALFSCSNDSKDDNNKELEGKLSTDLVHNPNSLKPNNTADKDALGHLQFTDATHVFSRLKEGEKVTYDFEYTNTGSRDVIITSAQAACGCTIPEYNHDKPIKPNEKGIIKVTFNSAGKKGHNKKGITVMNNGKPAVIELYIEADVD